MAKKRNFAPESSQLGEPPLKQHQYYQAFQQSSTSPFGQTNVVNGGWRFMAESQKSAILGRHNRHKAAINRHPSQIGHSGLQETRHRNPPWRRHGRYLTKLGQTNSVFGAAHTPSSFGASCSPAFGYFGTSMPAFAFEQSSTSPFGHTNSVFGQNNSSNNPFSPKPFGTTTPFGSQTDSYPLYRGTSTGVFDAAHTTSLIKSIFSMPAYKYLDSHIRKSLAEAVWKDPEFGKSLQLEAVGGFHTVPTMTWNETSQAFHSTRAIRIYFGEPSLPISIISRPTITEEHGGTSGQTAKLESISAMSAYDYERFESCVAIAGADYCVIAMDFTGNHSKISQLSGKSVMASCYGFEADVNALQEVLSAENLIYERQHNKPMSCPEIHKLFYHFQKCHPNHDAIVLGGLDSEGNGCLFQHFGFGAFASRVGDSSQNFGYRSIVPPILKYKLPAEDVLARLSETEAVDLAKTVFASTTNTGDKLEIVVLNVSGLRLEYVGLGKYCDRRWDKLEVIVPTATGVRCDRCYEQVFSRERKKRSISV